MDVYTYMSPWLSDLLLRSQTDERLIALSHLGHKRAFELIVERYRRPLSAYAHRVDPHRAEDLVQQTFLSAFSALQSGTEVRHLRAWLYEILRNQARREYASSTVLAELEESDSVTESAQQVAERRMLAVDALGAVAQLPARQHDAIVQMAFQGLSRTEVASSMGLSEGAVRQLVHRARATVRTAVTAITPMPVLRWLSSPKSGAGTGLGEVTLGAGTASGAGIALKVGVGAILASGVVAGGVISAVSPHPRAAIRLVPPAASIQAAAHHSTAASLDGAAAAGRGASGGLLASTGFLRHSGRRSVGRNRDGLAARVGQDGPGRQDGRGSRSGSVGPGTGDGGSGSGQSRGDGAGGSDHGSGNGSSGPGPGGQVSGGGDGGTQSGGGGADGSGSSGSGDGGGHGGASSAGTGGGSGSQPAATASGNDGGGSGSGDGGLVSSTGGGGQSSSTDGSGLTGSGAADSGSSGQSGSDGGASGSDGGSGSSSASGSGALGSSGH